MMKKIWQRLFIQISIIIVAFAAVLTVCNSLFMVKYYLSREKSMLKSSAAAVKKLDLNDPEASLEVLQRLEKINGLSVDIRNSDGSTIYTTTGFVIQSPDNWSGFNFPNMRRFQMDILESQRLDDRSYFQTLRDRVSNVNYLGFFTENEEGVTFELRVQKDMIEKNAKTANRFILIITLCSLLGALIYSYIFSRKFSKPIAEMNEITRNMANLNFGQKLLPQSKDEIGQLMLSVNHLSDTLDKTLIDLSEKNDRLQGEIERERALDEMRKGFIANVSHELKTPISIIKGYAEGLRIDMDGRETKKLSYCDVIINESDRMTDLVGDILELSKVESGQVKVELTGFDLSEMIDSAVGKMQGMFLKKSVACKVGMPRPQMVFADYRRIEQVLQSYLENAFSHVNEGGCIKISAEDGENGTVRLCVHNTGSRVSAEDANNIWQSFYRGDKSHNRGEGRHGLGLSIVRAIAQMHKMPCGVYNTDDGVTFFFDLKKH